MQNDATSLLSPWRGWSGTGWPWLIDWWPPWRHTPLGTRTSLGAWLGTKATGKDSIQNLDLSLDLSRKTRIIIVMNIDSTKAK